MDRRSFEARCFCGAVGLTVTGSPEAMGCCHCASCRSWSAAPVNAFTLWKPENAKVTRGRDAIGTFRKTERSHRQFCTKCGGRLMSRHPAWNLVDVYAGTIPGFRFAAAVHVHYVERVLPMRDGLPKLKDLPREMGGSGETLPE